MSDKLTDEVEEATEYLFTYKDALGNKLQASTKDKYKRDLRIISKLLGILPVSEMNQFEDADNIINLLHTTPYSGDKLYGKESLKSKIGVLGMLMEAYDKQEAHKKYLETYNDIKDEIMGEDKDGTSSKKIKEVENELTQKDIDAALDKFKDSKDLSGNQKYLAVALMSKIPARRTEYADTKIVHNMDDVKDDGNYLVMDSKGNLEFVFGKYKTKTKHGQQYLDVPDDLALDIFNSYNKFPRDYLFTTLDRKGNPTDKPMSSNTFVKHLSRIFKDKKISVNSFRKFSKNHNPHKLGAAKLAKAMGHSVGTAETAYKK